MALEIDIKANDDFEKSALRIAEALKKIDQEETKINALSKKLGVNEKQIAAGQKRAASDQVAEQKKIEAETAAKTKGEDDFNSKLELGVKGILGFAAAAVGAVAATYELGKHIGEAAFEADRARRGSEALVKAFSGDSGHSVIDQLDAQAKALGESVVDVRTQFVKFREAGVTNQVADQIIKARADMIALGISAEEADKRLAPVLAAGHNTGLAEAQLKFIAQAKGLEGVGKGAIAAKYALTSVASAQAQIHDDVETTMADLWKKIGPDIGRAAHALADFVEKLINSEEGKAAIDDIAESFHVLTAVVTNENLTTGFNAIRAVAVAVATVFDDVGTAIGFVASEIADFLGDAKLGDLLNPIAFLEKKAVGLGSSIVSGLVEGITGSKNAANDATASLAQGVGDTFSKALGIHSPSTVFAAYGKDTVAGYEQGQEQAIGTDPMPLVAAAKEPPIAPQAQAMAAGESPSAVAAQRPAETAEAPARLAAVQNQATDQSRTITIENLTVHSSGKPDDVARSIRQELQLLLRAGDLSRGIAA